MWYRRYPFVSDPFSSLGRTLALILPGLDCLWAGLGRERTSRTPVKSTHPGPDLDGQDEDEHSKRRQRQSSRPSPILSRSAAAWVTAARGVCSDTADIAASDPMVRRRSRESGRGRSLSLGWPACCLGFLLKLLAFLQAFAAVSVLLYAAWMFSRWARHHQLHLSDLLSPDLWFSSLVMAAGLFYCLLLLAGYLAAEINTGCCLCFVRILSSSLIFIIYLLTLAIYLCYYFFWVWNWKHPSTVHHPGHGYDAARSRSRRPSRAQRALGSGSSHSISFFFLTNFNSFFLTCLCIL